MEDIIKIPKVQEKIKIRDYGIIESADIEFKDGLNIIIGKTATGKSTVIRFLAKKSSPESLSCSENIMLQIDDILGLNQTILIDNSLCRLTKENLIKTLDKISKSGKQVILVLNDLSEIKDKIKANIIDTKDFKLKNNV